MSAFSKVRQLGYDLLAFGVPISDIKNMNVRELDYWAEVKRQTDEVERKQAEKMKNA